MKLISLKLVLITSIAASPMVSAVGPEKVPAVPTRADGTSGSGSVSHTSSSHAPAVPQRVSIADRARMLTGGPSNDASSMVLEAKLRTFVSRGEFGKNQRKILFALLKLHKLVQPLNPINLNPSQMQSYLGFDLANAGPLNLMGAIMATQAGTSAYNTLLAILNALTSGEVPQQAATGPLLPNAETVITAASAEFQAIDQAHAAAQAVAKAAADQRQRDEEKRAQELKEFEDAQKRQMAELERLVNQQRQLQEQAERERQERLAREQAAREREALLARQKEAEKFHEHAEVQRLEQERQRAEALLREQERQHREELRLEQERRRVELQKKLEEERKKLEEERKRAAAENDRQMEARQKALREEQHKKKANSLYDQFFDKVMSDLDSSGPVFDTLLSQYTEHLDALWNAFMSSDAYSADAQHDGLRNAEQRMTHIRGLWNHLLNVTTLFGSTLAPLFQQASTSGAVGFYGYLQTLWGQGLLNIYTANVDHGQNAPKVEALMQQLSQMGGAFIQWERMFGDFESQVGQWFKGLQGQLTEEQFGHLYSKYKQRLMQLSEWIERQLNLGVSSPITAQAIKHYFGELLTAYYHDLTNAAAFHQQERTAQERAAYEAQLQRLEAERAARMQQERAQLEMQQAELARQQQEQIALENIRNKLIRRVNRKQIEAAQYISKYSDLQKELQGLLARCDEDMKHTQSDEEVEKLGRFISFLQETLATYAAHVKRLEDTWGAYGAVNLTGPLTEAQLMELEERIEDIIESTSEYNINPAKWAVDGYENMDGQTVRYLQNGLNWARQKAQEKRLKALEEAARAAQEAQQKRLGEEEALRQANQAALDRAAQEDAQRQQQAAEQKRQEQALQAQQAAEQKRQEQALQAQQAAQAQATQLKRKVAAAGAALLPVLIAAYFTFLSNFQDNGGGKNL